jgi:hypothetical protein
MPETLFKASKEYTEEFGYKNIQEFILDLVRKKVLLKNMARYREIEKKMEQGKVKRFSQKDADNYLRSF